MSKQLYSIKQENSVSIVQEDNSKHSVMSLSCSVRFKQYLCNQVDNFARNEVSPTKQAKDDCSKEPIGDRNGKKKNPGRNQAQSGGPVLLWPDEPAWRGLIPGCNTGQTVQRTHLVPVVLCRWGSVSGAHLVDMVIAEIGPVPNGTLQVHLRSYGRTHVC